MMRKNFEKDEMTPRQRVLSALNRMPVDKIPWIEGIVENKIASKICNEKINVDWSVAPDGFPVVDGETHAIEQIKVNEVLGKANIQFSAFAPVFAKKLKKSDDGSPVIVGEGLIRNRESFEKLFKLPSPSDARFIDNARKFIKHKKEYCACACIRLGIGATLLSMGLEAFSYAMADEPDLIIDIHDAYADWTAQVVPVLEETGFDVIWAFDDVAFNSGPVFNPDFYIKHILPKEKAVSESFTKPLITHSDGDMTPILDEWLLLGQNAIHPIQPDVMDISYVKNKYGKKICLVGNIFMDHLVKKNPDDIKMLVRELIEKAGKEGGYVLSSSNSLTDDMKPENILAIKDALEVYGWY